MEGYFYTLQVTYAIHTQIEKEGKGMREDNNSRSKTRTEEKEGHGKAAAVEAVHLPWQKQLHGTDRFHGAPHMKHCMKVSKTSPIPAMSSQQNLWQCLRHVEQVVSLLPQHLPVLHRWPSKVHNLNFNYLHFYIL